MIALEDSEHTHVASVAPLDSEQSLEDAIRQRAYALYVQRGASDGNADSDWLTAEAEVLAHLNGHDPAIEE
ncbi:MAG TPA: DUF2934 domain-containing protein [Acidobacteriaceae bacterium]|nr:DUF2934 domain-containing protein [Acidobacteriaceae bacterium]